MELDLVCSKNEFQNNLLEKFPFPQNLSNKSIKYRKEINQVDDMEQISEGTEPQVVRRTRKEMSKRKDEGFYSKKNLLATLGRMSKKKQTLHPKCLQIQDL